VPGWHVVQADAPGVGFAVPATQCKQAAELILPVLGLYVPAVQLVHTEAPVPAMYVPTPQDKHDDTLVPPVLGL